MGNHIRNRKEEAIIRFDSGFNCAQSVLLSFSNELNLDKELALKLSCGFGGGMGRKQSVCGAISGGILVFGAKYGKSFSGNDKDEETTFIKTRELIDAFVQIHGTHLCIELLENCDLSTEEGQKKLNELDLRNKVCKECISTVVESLEEIIAVES